MPSESDDTVLSRASDSGWFKSSLIAKILARPYPHAIPTVVLASLVPVYYVIGALTPGGTLFVPEVSLDRSVLLQPEWMLVYGSIYVFAFLPVFVVRQEKLRRRAVLAYLAVVIVAYVGFVMYPTEAPRPARVIGEGFFAWSLALIYEFDIKRRTPGHVKIERRRTGPGGQKITQINKDYTVRGVYTSTSANARMGATETLMGDKGTIELSELDARVFFEPAIQQEIAAKKKAQRKAMSAAQQAKAVATLDSYIPPEAFREGLPLEVYDMIQLQAVADPKERFFALKNYVDTIQFNAFTDHIMNGGVPKSNQLAGLHTAISGIKGLEAIRQGGGMLEIDPALYEFDFETPEIYGYEFWDGPVPGQDSKTT